MGSRNDSTLVYIAPGSTKCHVRIRLICNIDLYLVVNSLLWYVRCSGLRQIEICMLLAFLGKKIPKVLKYLNI